MQKRHRKDRDGGTVFMPHAGHNHRPRGTCRCHSTIRQNDLMVLSCPDAIGKVIEKVMKYQSGEKVEVDNSCSISSNACPECGKALEYESGCVICRSCGLSKCG